MGPTETIQDISSRMTRFMHEEIERRLKEHLSIDKAEYFSAIEKKVKDLTLDNKRMRGALKKIYTSPFSDDCVHSDDEHCACDAYHCSNIAREALGEE